MAPQNASHFGSRGSRSSRSQGYPNKFGSAYPHCQNDFKGHRWSATTFQADMDSVRNLYEFPDSVALEVPSAHHGAVDSKGFAK